MFRKQVPMPEQRPYGFAVGLGLDTASSPLSAKPGSARGCLNYEVRYDGGFERVGGFERFDGRPRPSNASYTTLVPATSFSGIAAGDTLTGQTSGASGLVIYVSAAYVALTKVSGSFGAETILKAGNPVGDATGAAPALSGDDDNMLRALAGDAYRADITAVPGSGPIRGIAMLGSTLYAWRDNAGATAMAIYRSSPAGWVEVPRYYEFRFTAGGTAYTDGGTLTQGSVTATIKRVVLESGAWGGTAVGRLIVTQPTGGTGNFANGAATGTGTCTLASVPATSALAQITFLPGGRVETDAWNFYGGSATMRLYGCDGVNREFEFDGDVWVPLTTGMTARATFVRVHENILWFAFKSSLQKSAAGNPYSWSAVLGAAELGMGDDITGLATIPGDNASSSLAVTCKNRTSVLYGSTTSTFKLVPLSADAGANAYSLQSMSAPIGHDSQGFRIIRPSQSFSNFTWDIASRQIDRQVRNRTPVCSVFSKRLGRYRCFFADGSAISGTPLGKEIGWSLLDYGTTFSCAKEGELGGEPRIFYGGTDGVVYEADVGRSFDGQPITAVLRLSTITLGAPLLDKRWRFMDVEADGQSGFVLYASAEFDDGNPNNDVIAQQALSMSGVAARWDQALWDQARWDSAGVQRRTIEVPGIGYGIAPLFYTSTARELPHTIKSISLTSTRLTPRRP